LYIDLEFLLSEDWISLKSKYKRLNHSLKRKGAKYVLPLQGKQISIKSLNQCRDQLHL